MDLVVESAKLPSSHSGPSSASAATNVPLDQEDHHPSSTFVFNRLTEFHRARIVGVRAEQIDRGERLYLPIPRAETMTSVQQANYELDAGALDQWSISVKIDEETHTKLIKDLVRQ
jgi:DNA-directed RNA polymerase subunit K/omega